MNREILFRGKQLDNGKWMEGFYAEKKDPILPGVVKEFIVGADENSMSAWHLVDPATVGQYTGLTDRNGKKIFEGDLLLIGDGKQPVLVQFINFSWECTSEAIGPYYRHCLEEKSSKYEVIGNIHDNPELLQEAPNAHP